MSACREFEELLAAYADGGLEGRELERVEGHLDSCRACRDEVSSLARVMTQARKAAEPRPALDDRFWQDFSRQVAEAVSEKPSLFDKILGWMRRPAFVGGFCAMAAACLFFAYVKRPQELARPPVIALPEPPRVEVPQKRATSLPAGSDVEDLDQQQLQAVLRAFDHGDDDAGDSPDANPDANNDETLAVRDGSAATAEAIENLNDEELARVYAAL